MSQNQQEAEGRMKNSFASLPVLSAIFYVSPRLMSWMILESLDLSHIGILCEAMPQELKLYSECRQGKKWIPSFD